MVDSVTGASRLSRTVMSGVIDGGRRESDHPRWDCHDAWHRQTNEVYFYMFVHRVASCRSHDSPHSFILVFLSTELQLIGNTTL